MGSVHEFALHLFVQFASVVLLHAVLIHVGDKLTNSRTSEFSLCLSELLLADIVLLFMPLWKQVVCFARAIGVFALDVRAVQSRIYGCGRFIFSIISIVAVEDVTKPRSDECKESS